jgi:hypothetical protein
VQRILLNKMQELRSFIIEENCNNRIISFRITEIDMDDSIIYEVFENNGYLFSLSKDGKIIFNNLKNNELKNCLDSIINEIKKGI